MLSVLETWCGITGNWNNNYKTGNRISLLQQSGKSLKFDLCEEVRKWCDSNNEQMEHNGVQLKASDEKEGKYNILLSNDNSLYRNRMEVIIK